MSCVRRRRRRRKEAAGAEPKTKTPHKDVGKNMGPWRFSLCGRYSTVLMANIGTQLLHVALQMEIPRWGPMKYVWFFYGVRVGLKNCGFLMCFFVINVWFVMFFR